MKRGEKKNEMYRKVKAWELSGMSMTSYAKTQGMRVSGFKYWVDKHLEERKKESTEFVQIFPSVKANPRPMQEQYPPVEHNSGEIVFSFANGMTIRINL